jgi:hypothetical protein
VPRHKLGMATEPSSQRQRLIKVQAAYTTWLAGRRPAWFVTCAVNRLDPDPAALRRALKLARNVTHRRDLGPGYSGRRDRHMTGLFVFEGLRSYNPHIHLGLDYDTADQPAFKYEMNKGWRKLFWTGDVQVKRFEARHTKYLVKDITDPKLEELLGFIELL